MCILENALRNSNISRKNNRKILSELQMAHREQMELREETQSMARAIFYMLGEKINYVIKNATKNR